MIAKAELVGPACHGTEAPYCRGYGSSESGIVFIGIAPGRDESRTGKPFTGPSGRLLDSVLRSLDIDRSTTYCTNLICTWKDDPTRDESRACQSRLEAEIRKLSPKVIVLLGSIVTEYWNANGMKFGKVRGSVHWSEKWKCYVLSTYHPAAILHGMSFRGRRRDSDAQTQIYDLVRDLRKLKDIVTWEPGAPLAKVTYTVVSDPETAQSVLDELPRDGRTPVALDVETASPSVDEIDVFKDRLLCLGVSTPDQTWVFTPEAYRGSPLRFPDGVRWTMQNALFDVQVIRRELGVWIDVAEDTMLQSYSLDERPGVHRLKTLAREYLAAGFWEEERKVNGRTDWVKLDRDVLYRYNAHDAAYTARLCDIFTKRQDEDNVRDFYKRLLIPAVNTFKEIQLRGVKIDQDLLQEFAVSWGEQYLHDEDELIELAQSYGWPGQMNLNSPIQVSKFLYQLLSLPGGPSTAQKYLMQLRGAHPFVDKLIDFRHLSHMLDVYIFGMKRHIKDDGRVHATVKLHGTVTGRFAYTDPPLQTIPRTFSLDYEFARLRELFVPVDPESVIIEADYGKAEIRIAQAYSQDPTMLEDLNGEDYHSAVAAATMHKPLDQVTSHDRRMSKLVTFGVLYGREAHSLSEGIKVSVPEAQSYINGFFRKYPKYAEFYQNTQLQARKNGELVSAFGRKRRLIFLGSGVRTDKQAINYPIQSTTADYTLTSLLKLHEAFKQHPELGAYVLITVHDSIVCETKVKYLDETVAIIHEIMTTQHAEGMVRLPMEIKYGPSWGKTKFLHDCDKAGCLR